MMSIEVIYDYLKENLRENRFMHTLGVVSTSKKLASINNVDVARAELAALLHDISKNISKEDMLKIMKKNDIKLTLSEKETPELWHSIVGPIQAKEKFNINDEEILGAIRWHTTGKENMTTLEKIIYIADMIEPSRTFDGVNEIREEVLKGLDKGVLMGMNHTIAFLLSKNGMIDENTVKARNYLLCEISKA
ncbi:bis(5'-nucleosyl)-tetraphosphatase (symmetrical) YqeK [uncultured Clostridium sp.]|uniref:bis(5'-nucleosyl)-tetraphosphatase (symmetrical) YqeK n=1 Tax=uncultured Clostridium sp. TaxID=59620 RepID=UPI002633265B|nr:bis(5'-nucleosyl)-tetraphosphatase (symmetrical) YqeK [uncultured Clostridium sp.]